jgi:beta-1,4-N-acetylglucosaminyltransferase
MSDKYAFVTVGTTKFQDLIERMLQDDILDILHKNSFDKLIMQIGSGEHELNENESFIRNNIEIVPYRYKKSLHEDMKYASLVISHAGAGSIVEALEANRRLVVVINEKLMDNHQSELAEKMQEEGYCLYARCSNLAEVINEILKPGNKLKKYEKGTPELFGQYIRTLLD